MKSKSSKVIAMLVTAILLVSVAPAFAGTPVEPHNANAIWVEPAISLTTANPAHTIGYTFKVFVWVNMSDVGNALGIDTWQVRMYYNPAYLDAIAVDYSEAGPPKTSELFMGKATTPVIPAFGANYVQHGETCAPSYAAVPTGAKALFWVEFNVTAVPGKMETLTDVFDISNDDTFLIDTLAGEYPPGTVNVDDGQFTFVWNPPPPPHMAIEHDGFYGVPPSSPGPSDVWPLDYGPYPPSVVGAAFDVKIYIENLAAAWDLTSAAFCLCYNTTVIDVLGYPPANITLNTAVWDPATSTIAITHGDPDEIHFTVFPLVGNVPSGKVLVATVEFTILMQQESPPYPLSWVDASDLTFCDIVLEDHIMEIPTTPPEHGRVVIHALMALPVAWLEVDPPEVVMGPEPSVGNTFDVDIVVKGLDEHWYAIAYEFRLLYDHDLINAVEATEGPFLTDSTWNLYGTFFTSYNEEDPSYGWNMVVGGFLLPNATGEYDQTEFPNVDETGAVLATITFQVESQGQCPCEFTGEFLHCNLTLVAFWTDGDSAFVDRDGEYVPTDYNKYVDGHYMIYDAPSTGRFIDLYGGAYNAGYGAYPFPAPYGGQGLNKPMDLVIPQSEVTFFAKVEYNCWPVQSKDVGFEIEGPFYKNVSKPTQLLPKYPGYQVWAKLVSRTNSIGIAVIVFRMPWPCEDPENITGIWKVTATVNLADVIITDTLAFYYEHLVDIFKVTTDKYHYYHDDVVKVCIDYRTHALQPYPALFAIVITDELGVPFGMDAEFDTTIPAAERPITDWCTWEEDRFCVEIYIPKWAFTGFAYVHVSVYDKDPTEGGFSWGPEYTPLPEIYIMPLAPPTVYIIPAEDTLNQTAGEHIDYTATASGGWPVYTYKWYFNDIYLGETAQSWTLLSYTYLPAGTYDVEVKVEATDFYGYTAVYYAILHVVE